MTGKTLGHYRMVEKLGEGGMGEVWRAHDTQLDRDVALKVLLADALTDETARARLVREARLASKLNHPHVCTIHEVGESEGRAYIAMELIEGETLSARVAQGALPAEDLLRLGQQVADALAHAHERGVVHRDLKSANVVVTPEGRAKVLDFGLAKRLSGEALEEATTRTELTERGAVAGTLAYMAPEQLRGQPADARSDVWALGVMLYEMAAGRRPFQGQTGFELSSAILNQAPPPLPAGVPGALQPVIERCLAKDPGARYQRAGEVRAALEAISSGKLAPWAGWRYTLARRRWLVLAAALVVMVAVLAVVLRGRAQRAVKLAVLPFANLTGDPEQEYLSDGITQEMIAQLGRLHPASLSVIARTSVMRYKKTDKSIDQIGRELGVDYILEGSARREGSRIRISAELIQVRGQSQLWAESYENELAGILALQSEVARKVAGSLALRLLPGEQARLANARAVNPEAYDAYLKGLHHWHKLTPGDLESVQRYFELAMTKDPDYALAHAGMSLAWAGRQQMGLTPPAEAAPKAKAAALKAVALDETAAEAHHALAIVKGWSDWDWTGAEPEFKRAIEINPSFPDARAYYSHFLMIMRRPEEAMPQMERALQLDPLNELFQAMYGLDLHYVHRYDEAIAQFRKVLRTAPDHPSALGPLPLALFLRGMYPEALAAWKTYLTAIYSDRDVERALDRGYAEGGFAGAMRQAADALAARSRKTYVITEDIALLYVHAGEKGRALNWLEKGVEVRDPNAPYIGEPSFDSLRSEPRYQALLRKMNLPLN
jgi:serine/threonine-protein kinase